MLGDSVSFGAMSLTIERVICVQGGEGKKWPWYVRDVEVIDGVDFVKLSTGDSGFNRFVTGKVRGLRGCPYLQVLKKARADALLPTSITHAATLFDEPEVQTRASLKKQRTDILAHRPPTVRIKLPALTADSGEEVPGIEFAVKTAVCEGDSLAVELRTDVLEYLQLALKRSANQGSETSATLPKSKANNSNVYWRSDRSCFMAKRVEDGTVRYRAFKVEDADDQLGRSEAIASANAWVQETDVGSRDECV